MLLLIEAERRVAASWSAGLELRFFANTDPGGATHGLRREGFVMVRLSRFL